MKTFLTCILPVLLVTLNANGQAKDPYEMIIDGVKVIVHPGGNQIVVIQTVIKGGVQNYPASKAGIENMSLFALTDCGTKHDDKNSFKNKLNNFDAQLWGRTYMDYSVFSMNCISGDFNEVFKLYEAALIEPAFDKKEFERSKGEMINRLNDNESMPDRAIEIFAMQNAFENKNYAKNPQGTVKVLSALTAQETKSYWESILVRSGLVIVVVADLHKDTIRQKISGLLSKIPVGTRATIKTESYAPVANAMTVLAKENATNYIQGIAGAPAPGDKDYNAFIIAMQLFGWRHIMEIRSKHGLSYLPRVTFPTRSTSYSTISVSTTEPDKYITLVRMLIDSIKENGFTEKELKDKKNGYLTQTYMAQETNESVASSLVLNEVIHGDWKRSLTLKEDIQRLTIGQINDSFKKYINNISWVYHGDVKKVNPVLFTQEKTPVWSDKKKAF